MIKRTLAAALVGLLVLAAGCTMTPGGNDPDTRRAAINAGVDDALASLFRQVPGSEELVAQASGVLVFPNVLEAGFMIGASRGEGALRVDGATVSYHATTSGSFGLQAGAQSTAIFFLFMTDESLSRFQASSGWTAGVDASVTVVAVGATAQATTWTVQQPVVGYVLSNSGLMAGISLNGARITRLNL